MNDRTLRSVLWGASGFALGYLLPATLQLPVFAYDPIARRVLVAEVLSGVQMRYYGDVLWACAAALLGALLSRAVPQRRPLQISVAVGATLSLFALDVAWYLSRLLASV